MKHLRRKSEFEDKLVDLTNYAPVMTKDCEGLCDRKVSMTPEGPVIICDGCMRIVMDNRK
ncbi:MAG: hypothetical protein H0X63_00105 [Flavobacteriales bacterium]|nr:hypothetical protein [Flavobacteriales bacterium]